jgi:NhaP-type Na+/H+ or K+/H+ antiporter
MIVVFTILIGIFVHVLFQRWFPPRCKACDARKQAETIQAAVNNVPAQIDEESDVE